MTTLSATQIKQLQSLLQDRKRLLLDDLQRDAKVLRDESSRARDSGTDGGELSEADHAAVVSAVEMARDASELQGVELALERISRGAYGLCESCGDAIAPKRLLANPIAVRCMTCQTRYEKNHPEGAPHSL